MRLGRNVIVLAALATLASFAGMMATADDGKPTESRVPVPNIPHGLGDQCVEDAEFMRRNHMNLLMHQRDDTVLLGVRSKQYSLVECVSCHAVPGADDRPVTAASAQHFCRSCHDYAAVKIDCFQCHASRPDVDPDAGHHNEAIAAARIE